MKSDINIDAEICGFITNVKTASDDEQMVQFQIESTCDKIKKLAFIIMKHNPVDAFSKISSIGQGLILESAAENLNGCCAGCVVPSGIFKAMQVPAGLALPKDIKIEFN